MSLRTGAVLALSLATAALAAWFHLRDDGQGNLTAARPPNIIFILADDVSADELAPYGGSSFLPQFATVYWKKLVKLVRSAVAVNAC